MEHIAIIGMGISGSAVLTAYNKHSQNNKNSSFHIDCYDSEDSFGRGLPFRKDSDLVLLNTRSQDLGYDFEDLGDFDDWLTSNVYHDEATPEFSTRPLFGQYLRESMLKLAKSMQANIIYSQITSINWNSETNTWIITDATGQSKEYDRVHLCCGSLPTHDPYQLSEFTNYIANPYPLDQLPSGIGKSQSAIVIGTNLTAIDVIKYLSQAINMDTIYAFSRQNNFPVVGLKRPANLELSKLTLPNIESLIAKNYKQLSFEILDELIEYEFNTHNISLEIVNSIVQQSGTQGLRQSFVESDLMSKMEQIGTVTTRILIHLWQYMPEADRARFEEKYHDAFTLTKGKIPLLSAEAIIDAEDNGQLHIVDDVSDIIYDEVNQQFIMVDKNKNEIVRADWVVNATGLKDNLELETVNHPLLEDLLNKRYIATDTAGGISINADYLTVISPSWGEFSNLHAHGSLISGAVYLTNSTYTIQYLADMLIEKLFT
ncbi:FAD/NAD(P)-binding protein [Aerococcaceae bacterium WGS1372]